MRTSRFAWSLAGIVAGVAGLAASYFAAMAMTIRDSPVVAVAELVIRLTPGPVAERAIGILGHLDKPFLVLVILVALAAVFAYAGRLARRSWWLPAVVYAVLAAIGVVAVATQPRTSTLEYLPIAVGFATWLICLSLMTEPLRRAELLEEAEEAEATASKVSSRPPGTRRPAAGSCSGPASSPLRRSWSRASDGWSAPAAGTWRRPAGCCGCPV